MWPFTRAYPERSIAAIEGRSYDYIIVGGGTAGCVLAARLSRDPAVSVLLLERGPLADGFMTRIPLLGQNYRFPWVPAVNDRYSEPIANCLGRRLELPSGEGLGGTTRINGLLHTRGPPGGYNGWADGLGLAGWDWASVEPYFRRMENATDHPGKTYRGHAGPLPNRVTGLVYEFYPYMARACAALGLPIEDDCNKPSASAQGFFRLDATVGADNTRMSVNRAYLGRDVALAREKHLDVCTGVIATKLQVDAATKTVTGVHVAAATPGKGSTETLVHARREVILCGGAFRTPQLLLLSGIGPRDDLAKLDIDCVHDLPAVGAHLADHLAVPIMVELPVRDTAHRLRSALVFLWELLLYCVLGWGLLGFPTNAVSIFARMGAVDDETMTVQRTQEVDGATTDTMDASVPANVPDVEVMLCPVNCVSRDLVGRGYLTLYTTLVQACTHGGRVTLASADPRAHARVSYPFLRGDSNDSSGSDWPLMRKAVRFAMRLADEFAARSGYPHATPLTVFPGMDSAALRTLTPFVEWSTQPEEAFRAGTKSDPPKPVDTSKLTLAPAAPDAWRTVSDADIDAYMPRVAQSSLHFTSSCRMAVNPRDGVVDTALRVHGLSRLRIADASVLPRIPSAHTMAPVIMVAERCADFVKTDWAAVGEKATRGKRRSTRGYRRGFVYMM